MSRVFNVSNDLGKFLLEGWTPSDQTCPAEGCHGISLRSPEGRNPVTWFCTSCRGDGSAHGGLSQSEQQHPSSPSLASSTHYSRSSTPPTEESHDPGSITFTSPVETEESIRRRQQSDSASVEIGKRLLKGWAMLADECPSSTCYGIPLVRPPTTGRDKDLRKECVVCGTVYVTETEKKVVEGSSATAKGKEKTSRALLYMRSVVASKVTHSNPLLPTTSSFPQELPTFPTRAFSNLTSDDTLANSSKALGATLGALSQRLMLLSDQPILDPITISQTADAIAKTGQALAVINMLRHNQE
ncbi:hypothetical protein BJV77DRAFT_977321 [Russula vinacea]|nr:hypothetical protein BJV77DRAFT_977321 [Russula vinacea]